MSGLFQQFNPLVRLATNQYGLASSNQITRGSLISFHYPHSFAYPPNVIHDPYPMVILTDVWPHAIRGLNLHYLTFPYVKRILENFGGNTGFSYFYIKPDKYLADAFRTYIREGVLRPKRLDSEWLKTVLGQVRNFNPGEIEKIRASIQQQIQARLQAKANELTAYDQWRKNLTRSQQNQFRTKVNEIQDVLAGGINRDLIKPEQNIQAGPENVNLPEFPDNGAEI